ncbi:hypothetical protein B0J14DRAFT_673242 [Halenospora varia]|nr:hypothetical protein B0J14DRAFT_673242 [Halenospora varia]
MHSFRTAAAAVFAASIAVDAPTSPTNSQLPVAGISNIYNDYRSITPPYPGNETEPIFPKSNGTAGPDDLLYQNLLSAEWAIFSFYQQGVERCSLLRLSQLSAGHLQSFQSQISDNSLKPGLCKYAFGVTNAQSFVVTLTLLEIASMTFLTGLVQQANTLKTRADTSFPCVNQILDTTNQFIIPGSYPQANPEYPYPNQHLPQSTYNPKTNSSLTSNTEIEYIFATPPPAWEDGKPYYVIFFHELLNISMPFNTKTNTTTIPNFKLNKGLIVGVIADTPGAPTLDTGVAGPVLIIEQPAGAKKHVMI